MAASNLQEAQSECSRAAFGSPDGRCPSGRVPGLTAPSLQDGPVSYPKLHLPLETLWGLFKQQLRVELATTVSVESVEKPVAESKEVKLAVGAEPGPRVSPPQGLSSTLLVPWAGHARLGVSACLLPRDSLWGPEVGSWPCGCRSQSEASALGGLGRMEAGRGQARVGTAWNMPRGPSTDLEGHEASAGSCGDPRPVSLGPISCHGANWAGSSPAAGDPECPAAAVGEGAVRGPAGYQGTPGVGGTHGLAIHVPLSVPGGRAGDGADTPAGASSSVQPGAGQGRQSGTHRLLPQALQALPTQGESFMSLARDLGARTFSRHEVQRQKSSGRLAALKQHYRQYLRLLASDAEVPEPCLPRQYWEALGVSEPPQEQPWPLPMQVELGKLLVEILMKATQMPSNLAKPRDSSRLVPVLYHVYSFRNVYQIGFVKPHPAYVQLLATAAEPTLIFEAGDVPMLCPPLPWTSPHTGAFLLSPTKLMRAADGTMHHQRLLENCPPAALHGALDTLNQLGNCAWRVNGRVLDLVLELFQDKGCPKLGVPAPPSEVARPHEAPLPPSTGLVHKSELRRELARSLKEAHEMHSLRADALYRLSLAQHLRDCIFWLPHNMDFRGRTYPCPPHFTHLGNDVARALLEFAQGRPLGPHGLDWLKIHVVNLTGLKKREPLQARRAFAEEVMDDILDSADEPMTAPLGTLATALSIRSPYAPSVAVGTRPATPHLLPTWVSCRLLTCASPRHPPPVFLRPHTTAPQRARGLHPHLTVPPPLSPQGRKWWMDSEEPWQTLACCMEIAKAVRSSDPAAYISHLPVHQDGSCNGLQHYAALGRDSVGAASVNLEPSDVPQDVYSDVAAQVEALRREDARRGSRVAKVLEGFVTRKVVKQTVMTVVYGVTRFGGRLQIEKRLRELSDFPQEFLWEASQYLVRQVFRSLQEMFSGSRAIQHWLTESARLISHMGSAVEWVTPLGIPIIQPYHKEIKVKQGRNGIQSVSYSVNADSSLKPNKRKQRNGFPPNFIHSLDSTHMMLTALHCYREGLTFVSVHDCFWTHAADVPIMNQVPPHPRVSAPMGGARTLPDHPWELLTPPPPAQVCREQFVRLHSQPILQDLSRFLISRFCRSSRPQKPSQNLEGSKLRETLLAVPEPGTFDLERVKRSTFFFS
ncbi:DNA-directed RNA polymerase, mitochondrial [Plecturocebus cupreus]